MAIKETTTEKYIKKAVEEAVKTVQNTTMSDCNFIGVNFDEKASEAIHTIAEALATNACACQKNADALKQLSYVLKATGVEIESMVHIGQKEGNKEESLLKAENAVKDLA